jgi:hypothetical protein
MEENTRLTRIEEKLDKVSEALNLLVRVEERLITLFKRMDNYDSSLQAQNAKINELEKKVYSSAWVERVVWVIVAAGVAAVIKLGGA